MTTNEKLYIVELEDAESVADPSGFWAQLTGKPLTLKDIAREVADGYETANPYTVTVAEHQSWFPDALFVKREDGTIIKGEEAEKLYFNSNDFGMRIDPDGDTTYDGAIEVIPFSIDEDLDKDGNLKPEALETLENSQLYMHVYPYPQEYTPEDVEDYVWKNTREYVTIKPYTNEK
jgi:hypothetical protein